MYLNVYTNYYVTSRWVWDARHMMINNGNKCTKLAAVSRRGSVQMTVM